ncbi:MAG: DUF2341 domain-containing protein, partial [FCB group bacterium]|nr:DUF2341 domain-containing protein [FCB group bacterium]
MKRTIFLVLMVICTQHIFANWQYRRTISIEPANEFLTEHQILLTLTPNNFDYAHSAGDGGNDLRFSTNGTGNTTPDVPYWIEEWNENDTSKVWIKVPYISNLNPTIVYMYYG